MKSVVVMEGVDEFTAIIDSINQLSEKMEVISKEIQPYLNIDYKVDVSKLSPVEASNLHVVLAQTITACFESIYCCSFSKCDVLMEKSMIDPDHSIL